MDDENKYTVDDLIKFSVDQRPTDFEDAFNSLVLDKIAVAVDAKKLELAASLYNGDDEEEEDYEVEDADSDDFEEPEEEDLEEYEEEDSADGEEAA